MDGILMQLRGLAKKYKWLYREDHWQVPDGYMICEASMRSFPNVEHTIWLQWINKRAAIADTDMIKCRVALRDLLVKELTKAGENLTLLDT